MTSRAEEPTIRDRLEQRPRLLPSKIKEATPKELGIRFGAGAITSIASGGLTLLFGARVGGILLGVPAIMAASLTLIEQEEDSVDAREDARGAIVGAAMLTLFAVVAALAFTHLAGGLVLLLASAVWLAGAVLGYAVAWWR